MNFVYVVDDLKGVCKIKLAIHLLEDLEFTPTYDVEKFIKLFKKYWK